MCRSLIPPPINPLTNADISLPNVSMAKSAVKWHYQQPPRLKLVTAHKLYFYQFFLLIKWPKCIQITAHLGLSPNLGCSWSRRFAYSRFHLIIIRFLSVLSPWTLQPTKWFNPPIYTQNHHGPNLTISPRTHKTIMTGT